MYATGQSKCEVNIKGKKASSPQKTIISSVMLSLYFSLFCPDILQNSMVIADTNLTHFYSLIFISLKIFSTQTMLIQASSIHLFFILKSCQISLSL